MDVKVEAAQVINYTSQEPSMRLEATEVTLLPADAASKHALTAPPFCQHPCTLTSDPVRPYFHLQKAT